MLLCGNNTLKQKAVRSSMVCCVDNMYFYTTQQNLCLRELS
jgi:hypothetical protein